MSTQLERLIAVSQEAWREVQGICPDRDSEADINDPGNGPHCKNSENPSCMGWCEPQSCPRADF